MKLIYWSPANDISSVIRGTWFYKDTMLPVESEVAAQLEDGYSYNKPWTQTWQDELNSCVEAGAEGEAKAVHRLWLDMKFDVSGNRPKTGEARKASDQSLEIGSTRPMPKPRPNLLRSSPTLASFSLMPQMLRSFNLACCPL